MEKRKLFIAGSTGAVGRTLVRQARKAGDEILPHLRPRSAERQSALDPDAVVIELADHQALVKALQPASTVIQLIGTMRKRFSAGDTYQTSDIGTTRQLVNAALEASIDHFVLLSSVGAGNPIGAYLKAKAEAERIVTESSIAWTIFRPSSFDGEGHKPPPGMGALTRLLRLRSFEPIRVDQLAASILRVARERGALGQVLEGQSLWEWVR